MYSENKGENIHKQMEEMMQKKDDQGEGMSEASEDKSQMANKDQSGKTKGEMMDKQERDIKTLMRRLKALIAYSVHTRSMVRALMYYTDKNGLLPPDDEAFWRKAEEAVEVSGGEWVLGLVRRNVPVQIVPPSGEAITLEEAFLAGGDEKESIPEPTVEIRGPTTREIDCHNCGRSTLHEYVGWQPASIPPLYEHSGCYVLTYRCQNCGDLYRVLRIPRDSPLWIDLGPSPENGGDHEVPM